MSTHVPGFQSFFSVFALFCIGKLAPTSIRVKLVMEPTCTEAHLSKPESKGDLCHQANQT